MIIVCTISTCSEAYHKATVYSLSLDTEEPNARPQPSEVLGLVN